MSADSHFRVKSTQDVQVLRFDENWTADLEIIQETAEALYGLVNGDGQKFVLDFCDVQFLSSAALSVFVTFRKNLQARRGHLVVCGLNGELRKLFKITALEKLFTFADDDSAAIEELGIIKKITFPVLSQISSHKLGQMIAVDSERIDNGLCHAA